MNDLTLEDLLVMWPEKNPSDRASPDFYEGQPPTDAVIICDWVFPDPPVVYREIDIVDKVSRWSVYIRDGSITSYGREFITIGEKERYIRILEMKDHTSIIKGIESLLNSSREYIDVLNDFLVNKPTDLVAVVKDKNYE